MKKTKFNKPIGKKSASREVTVHRTDGATQISVCSHSAQAMVASFSLPGLAACGGGGGQDAVAQTGGVGAGSRGVQPNVVSPALATA